jgi:hypothetical protein
MVWPFSIEGAIDPVKIPAGVRFAAGSALHRVGFSAAVHRSVDCFVEMT